MTQQPEVIEQTIVFILNLILQFPKPKNTLHITKKFKFENIVINFGR